MHGDVYYHVLAMCIGSNRVMQAQQGHVWALREGVRRVCVVQGSGVRDMHSMVRSR